MNKLVRLAGVAGVVAGVAVGGTAAKAETINIFAWTDANLPIFAESGATRTPIPAQGGQHSGDCGQRVMVG
jgi:hypothetical protein